MTDFEQPVVVGIAGPSGSGKTTLCRSVADRLASLEAGHAPAHILSCDNYYIPLPAGTDPSCYNFDEPCALDFALFASHLDALKRGEAIDMPVYDFATHSRTGTTRVEPRSIIFVEGLFTLHAEAKLLPHLDVKIFLSVDADECLARRVMRDVEERGRGVADIIAQYRRYVKPANEIYILPSQQSADIVVPADSWRPGALSVVIHTIVLLIMGFESTRDAKVEEEAAAKT